MKFDITKVRFEGYLCGLKAGCEGYFSDTMSGLQHCVEEDYRFNFGKIKKINENSEFPFVNKVDVEYRYFYLVEEPKEKKYRPYKLEDFDKFFNKGFEHKEYKFRVRVNRIEYENNTLYINGVTAQNFLEKYVWLDGSPCGAEITDE